MTSLNGISSSPSEAYLSRLQQRVDNGDDAVIDPIMFQCKHVQSSEDAEKVCALLFQVFPRLSEQQLNDFLQPEKSCLPSLLPYISPEQQQTLSLQLAFWFSKHVTSQNFFAFSLQAMHFFAKAIQIGNYCSALKDIHRFASQLFMPIVGHIHATFKQTLLPLTKVSQDDHCAFSKFEAHIEQIAHLKRFCYEENDYQVILSLYEQAASVLKSVQGKYDACSKQVFVGLNEPYFPTKKAVTEKYWEALLAFRDSFLNMGETREYQKNVTLAFKELFKILIEDALVIVGPPPSTYVKMKYSPPCRFDIRAMGSLAREEVCPYSDLEFLILVEREDAIPFFKMVVQILEIQIASLGETSTDNPVFTCIHTKNPSGFHIDSGGNPALHSDLIQTPSNMAKLQNNPVDDPQTIENTVLKTISLYQSDSSLFTDYQGALQTPLNTCREERAYKFFALRYADYQKHWHQPFNSHTDIIHIKKQYVEVLNHLLGDMALFCAMTETNTLDIIDALVAQKIFTPDSGVLLKESVAAIYKIRIRLHLHYKEQKEEASCLFNPSFASLTPQEVAALEKCYWLVLRPLYIHLHNVVDPWKEGTSTFCKRGDFKEVFHEVDLIEIAFQENFTPQSDPLIKRIASYLCSIKAPVEKHVKYFTMLSKECDLLRESYLKIVEENNFTAFQKLLHIPNRAGLRPIFLKNYQKLQEKLYEITEHSSSQILGKTEVLITAHHFLTPRYLEPCHVQQLMNGQDIKSLYDNSAHNVCFIHNLHLKQKPSNPLMEYAIHSLTSRIAGELTPSSILVRFDVSTKGKKKSYPVLIAQTIAGQNLKEAWQRVLPNSRFTWTLLCSILTRPGDGRLSNYILDDYQNIHCIDNDLSFVEPVVSSFLSRTVYFCCVLFCLFPLEAPLNRGVLQEFSNLDPYAIIEGWIDDLIQKEQEYIDLFTEDERKRLYEEDPNNAFIPTILFREGTIATLHFQFLRLQQIISLSLEKEKPLTIGDLLKELISLREESIGPYVYKSYLNTFESPEKKLQKATSRVQEKSMTSIQYHEACLGKIPSIKEIEQAKLFSIEEARKEFLCTIFEKNSSFVTLKNQGTVIQANFKDLNQNYSRQTLVLRALLEQVKASSKNIRSLIIHHSQLLTSTLLEPFLFEGLEVLDLRYCTQIGNSALRHIEKKCPQLKILLLSGCTRLTEISGTSYGISRLLKFPKLEHCDLSHCSELRLLKLNAPCLEKLDFKYSPLQLEGIELTHAPFWRTLSTEKGILLENDSVKALEFLQKILKLQIQAYGENHPILATTYDAIGLVYNSSGKYDKALVSHQKALQIKHTALGDKHPDVATSYNYIGNAYNGLRDYESALKYHKMVLEIRREVLGDKHPDVVTTYNNIGAVSRNLGYHNEALDYFKKSLMIGSEVLGDKHPNVAAIHSNIGGVHDSLGSVTKALKHHRKALDIRLEVLGKKHPDVAASYNNLGLVYRNRRCDYDQAMECQKKALEIRLEVLGDKHPDVATSYNNIGLLHDDLGNYTEALECHKKAYNILLELLGDKHPDVATSKYHIGSICETLRDYKTALEFAQPAFDIRLQTFGKNNLDVAKCYNLLGKIHYGQGKLDKALDCHFTALQVRLDMLGDKHPDVAASYNNIGEVYNGLEKYDEALKFCEPALEMRLALLGDKHPDVAASYNNLGAVHRNRGNYDKTLESFNKALEIGKIAFGDKHPKVAAIYSNIGGVQDSLGNYDEALQHHQTALKIRLEVLGPKHLDVAASYNSLGLVHRNRKDYVNAMECLQKALEIRREVLTDNHPDVAASHNNIGLIYDDLENYYESLRSHKKALNILLEILGDKHPDVATCHYNIGSVYYKLGDYNGALDFCQTALKIRLQAFDENHPEVIKCYNLLAKVYEGLGKLRKEIEFRYLSSRLSL